MQVYVVDPKISMSDLLNMTHAEAEDDGLVALEPTPPSAVYIQIPTSTPEQTPTPLSSTPLLTQPTHWKYTPHATYFALIFVSGLQVTAFFAPIIYTLILFIMQFVNGFWAMLLGEAVMCFAACAPALTSAILSFIALQTKSVELFRNHLLRQVALFVVQGIVMVALWFIRDGLSMGFCFGAACICLQLFACLLWANMYRLRTSPVMENFPVTLTKTPSTI